MTRKHNVFYFNDRKIPAMLFRNTLGDLVGLLEPAEGREVEIELEDGQIPFIKVWETNSVLIGGMDPNSVVSLRVQE